MNLNNVKVGVRVKIAKLDDTEGMLISSEHLEVRKVGITGIITRYVPGHGGHVWLVKHDEDDNVGAYMFDEFEEA